MHEVGITQSLVEIAEQHIRESGYHKVLSVTVEIGEFSGVVADAVEFCFEAVVQQSLLKGSKLIVKQIAGKKRCNDCHNSFAAGNYTFECPSCGSFSLSTIQGDELRITEMEVE